MRRKTVRLTESNLKRIIRRVIKEQAGGLESILVDYYVEDEGAVTPREIERAVSNDVRNRFRVKCVNPSGPGGGNPEILLTGDAEELWSWFTDMYGGDDVEYDMAQKAAQRYL